MCLTENCDEKRVELNRKYREEVFNLLGHECQHCGFSDKRALQVDHVHNDGYLEGDRGKREYRNNKQVRDAVLADPKRFQILCANCNWIKEYENRGYGV